MSRFTVATVVAVVSSLALAAPALAGTAFVDNTGAVVFEAADGETNTLTITRSGGSYTIDDSNAITAGMSCMVGMDATVATCNAASTAEIQALLGNMPDSLTISASDNLTSVNGGAGADTLNGDSGGDVFTEPADNDVDTHNGNGGADELRGGGGADVLNGGAGADELYGSDGGDTLNGGDDGDLLRGGSSTAAADTLNGNGGSDDIDGEQDDDIVRGGAGADLIRDSGTNPPFFLAGDTLTYEDDGVDRSAGVTVRADNGADDDGAAGEGDEVGDGFDTLHGSAGPDQIFGADADERIDGRAGADTLRGAAGNDRLFDSPGPDDFGGGTDLDGEDNDEVSFDVSGVTGTGVRADMDGVADDGRDGGAAGDNVRDDLEVLRGATFTDDVLTGSDGGETITGMGGNDTLDGKGGNDVLHGYFGSDTLIARDGENDLVNCSGSFLGTANDGSPDTVAADAGDIDDIEGCYDNDTVTKAAFVPPATDDGGGGGGGGGSGGGDGGGGTTTPGTTTPGTTTPGTTTPGTTTPGTGTTTPPTRIGAFTATGSPAVTAQRVETPDFRPTKAGGSWRITSLRGAQDVIEERRLNVDLSVKRVGNAGIPDSLRGDDGFMRKLDASDIVAQSPTPEKVPTFVNAVTTGDLPAFRITVYDPTKNPKLDGALDAKGCAYERRDSVGEQLREALVGPLHTSTRTGAADRLDAQKCGWELASVRTGDVEDITVRRAAVNRVQRAGMDERDTLVALHVVAPKATPGLSGNELAIVLSVGTVRTQPGLRSLSVGPDGEDLVFTAATQSGNAYNEQGVRATIIERATGMKVPGAKVELFYDAKGEGGAGMFLADRGTDGEGNAGFLGLYFPEPGMVRIRASWVEPRKSSDTTMRELTGERLIPVRDRNCADWTTLSGYAFEGKLANGKCLDGYQWSEKASPAGPTARASGWLEDLGKWWDGVKASFAGTQNAIRNGQTAAGQKVSQNGSDVTTGKSHADGGRPGGLRLAGWQTCSLDQPRGSAAPPPQVGYIDSVFITGNGVQTAGRLPAAATNTGTGCAISADAITSGTGVWDASAVTKDATIVSYNGATLTPMQVAKNVAAVIAAGGGNVRTADVARVIAAGGGNLGGAAIEGLIRQNGRLRTSVEVAKVIAAGGLNLRAAEAAGVIAAGGGNVIKLGDVSSVIAAGALNLKAHPEVLTGVIAAGGGNFTQQQLSQVIAAGGLNLQQSVLSQLVAASQVIAAGGGNVIAAGGANVIAAGGGNIINLNGSNIISDKGLGVIAAGGGNVIAAGGGNVLSAGSGN